MRLVRRRDLLAVGATALASVTMPRAGFAQSRYPERPIKLMVAFSAGGVNDAVARQWAERNAASAFIIPTEMFSARRVRWIFQRELSGRGVTIEVPSFEPLSYTRGEWWKAEQGVVAFQNEVLKYIYYRLKY